LSNKINARWEHWFYNNNRIKSYNHYFKNESAKKKASLTIHNYDNHNHNYDNDTDHDYTKIHYT
jgi:hypothetical protein